MYQYRYRLTLYNTTQSDKFLTYNFPHLPAQSDMVEVCEGLLFEVKARCFQPRHEGKIIHVILHGIIAADDMGKDEWKETKEIIHRYHEVCCNRVGRFVSPENFSFPESLD